MEITAQMLRDMLISAANNLENNKQAINDLNVFPVPDGDTGTNMSLTMGAAKSKLSGTCLLYTSSRPLHQTEGWLDIPSRPRGGG